MNGADGFRDLLRARLLQQVTGRARAHRGEDLRVLDDAGQDEHLGARARVLEELRRLDAAHLGHGQVHQDDVRAEALSLVDGLASVRGLPRDDDVVLELEQHLQPVADDRVVVRDEHLDRTRSRANHSPLAAAASSEDALVRQRFGRIYPRPSRRRLRLPRRQPAQKLSKRLHLLPG